MPTRTAPPNALYYLLPPALLLFLWTAPPVPAADTLPDAADALAAELEQARGVQQQAEKWAAEREELLAEQRELSQYLLWLKHQNGKYEGYIARREHAVEQLVQRRQEAGTIRLRLEPLLDELAADLARIVDADLPFLAGERASRLRDLDAVLGDYDTPLGEKLRRFLESLLVEVRYGSELASGPAVIETQAGSLQGRTLRVGRLAEYFLSRDRQRALLLERDGSWRELDRDFTAPLGRALDMAEHAVPAGPVALPAPAPRAPAPSDTTGRSAMAEGGAS